MSKNPLRAGREALLLAALLVGAALGLACADEAPPAPGTGEASAPQRLRGEGQLSGRFGGRLVVALRAEPSTFNPVYALGPSKTLAWCLMARLVRLDPESQQSEPILAASWTVSEDGRRIALELRRGLRFSDGHPLDADDVVFTFQVHLDEDVASNYRNNLLVGGEPVRARKTGSHSIELELAEPSAEGVALIDAIDILPRHRLEEAYREGRFAETWGSSTAPHEVVGTGPFRLKRFVPGERVELERNPHYWRVDQEGRRLPYLDELTFLLVPSEEAQVVRFQAGETHLIDRLSARSFHLLESAGERDYQLTDLGPGLDFHFLFFNLNDVDVETSAGIADKQTWFGERGFRQALSLAVDRQGIVRLVYQRRATGIASHVTPSNKRWFDPTLELAAHSPERARRLLESAGFSWNGAGRLLDAQGQQVTFSIAVNSGNPEQMAIVTVILEDLRRIGIEAQARPLEYRALVDRLLHTFEYEACVLGLSGYPDPNHFLAVWRSDGNSHLWRLTPGPAPPPWQVEVDRLMQEQQTTLDPASRKGLYDRVQAILAEQEPYILLVSPNVLVGAHRRVGNFAPTVLDPPTLWNVDELYWRGNDSSGPR